MNVILFDPEELNNPLPYSDERAVHMKNILGLHQGDEFFAGVINGPLGKGILVKEGPHGWIWSFQPESESPPLRPLTLVLGCPRPPVARRLLKDMSSLGIREIRCCSTDLNEKSYLGSKLWREGLWKKALREGAIQGISTRLPQVQTAPCLAEALQNLPEHCERIALDNGPGAQSFHPMGTAPHGAILAIGPERGWSEKERQLLEEQDFQRCFIGSRVMRTETSCALGSGLMLHAMQVFTQEGNTINRKS
ncbi:MAG: 16S rRNA (uracil(1498)-N(3))-methyltransferase [Spirochaetales bacterium]|nr:16S rRNA (uracil(1498)-N(3))-methyltransferase [Spirochaetales bacterium]